MIVAKAVIVFSWKVLRSSTLKILEENKTSEIENVIYCCSLINEFKFEDCFDQLLKNFKRDQTQRKLSTRSSIAIGNFIHSPI